MKFNYINYYYVIIYLTKHHRYNYYYVYLCTANAVIKAEFYF